MSKILVTGATGFTGGHLARRLAKDGHDVRTLARAHEDCTDLEAAGIEVIRGDLRDPNTLPAAVQHVEIVYHIAAAFREEGVPRQFFWDVNVEGTRNLMDACIPAGIKRFVHCSTVGVQGEIKNPPATEEAPYNPGDHYQSSKVDGEKLVLRYIQEKAFPAVIFRPVGIYGPGDTRFLKLFRFARKGRFPMLGSGNVLYHLTYIDDLVGGIILTGTVPNIQGEIFTLGGAEYVMLNELVQLIGEALDKSVSIKHFPVWPVWLSGAVCEMLCRPFGINPPLYRRRVDFFIKDRAFDITKAKSRLGYAPKVDLKSGLKRTAEWYNQKNLLD